MLAEVGLGALLLAFGAALYGLVAALAAGLRHREDWLRSARNACLLTFPLLLLSCAALAGRVAERPLPAQLRLVGHGPGHAVLLPLHRALGLAAGLPALLVAAAQPVLLSAQCCSTGARNAA